MAAKNSDILRELSGNVTTLNERVDNIRQEIERLCELHNEGARELKELSRIVTILDDRSKTHREVWMLIVGAIIGAIITLIFNALTRKLT